MEPEQDTNPLLHYLDMARRRKWLIITPFTIALAASVYLCVALPAVYRSETTILVEPQQVPEDYVQSTVTGSVQDRLNTISQQILSRTTLEAVIRELGLYAEMQRQAPMEDVVNSMRKQIEIRVEERPNARGTGASAAAFKLAYHGEEPEVVQRVTNRLAMMYIEENLKVRETQARGTKEFLERQLQEIEQNLRAREAEIQQFKQAHMGELPEQQEANLRALEQLQQQKTSLMEAHRNSEDRQILLERELSGTVQYLAGTGTDQTDIFRQLESKRQELTSLKTRYTELYPDVVRVKKEIQELERRVAALGRAPGNQQPQEDAPALNPAWTRIRSQVDANLSAIENQREELESLNLRMRRLQQRIENVPKREQELTILTRDYDTIKQSYDSMMARKINAEIAENLETRQKSEQFHVLDPANYPQKPVKPNRLRLLGLGLALGLGCGAGLAFAADYMDRSFKKVEDLKAAFALPVVGIIPVLETRESIRRSMTRRIATVSFSCGFLVTLVLGIHLFVMRIDELASKITSLLL
ncbi:MAG: XrtA system polysaccharide chain length determinant [bacterium]